MKQATPRPRNRKPPSTANTEETVLDEEIIDPEEVDAEVALLPAEDIKILAQSEPSQAPGQEDNGPVMNRLYQAPQRFIRPFNSNFIAEQADLRPS